MDLHQTIRLLLDTPKEKDGKSETVKGNEILKKAPLANGTTPVARVRSFTKYWRSDENLGLSLFGLGTRWTGNGSTS